MNGEEKSSHSGHRRWGKRKKKENIFVVIQKGAQPGTEEHIQCARRRTNIVEKSQKNLGRGKYEKKKRANADLVAGRGGGGGKGNRWRQKHWIKRKKEPLANN